MIDEAVRKGMRERYKDVHPLVWHRSCGYAKSAGDLFDILEGLPRVYPIVWDSKKHQWITVSDVTQSVFKD